MKEKLELKTMAINELVEYKLNAKLHPPSQIKQIENSIKKFGMNDPIGIDETTKVVIEGHGRLIACRNLGMTEVPVLLLGHLDEKQQRAYRIAHNKINMNSGFDNVMLGEEIIQIDEVELFMDSGFTEREIGEILIDYSDDNKPKKNLDDAPPLPETPMSKLGDLYQLGRHRLLCGDATKPEDVARLMGGVLSTMIFTDPPYNVDYGVSKKPKHKIRTIENDKQSPKEWESFCKAIFENFKRFNTGDIYMWGASGPEGMRMRLWLTEMGCHWSATIIWKKQQLILTPANYQRMYEPCFYGWFDKSTYNKDRKQTEVWELDRPLNSKLHPTMKPVDLCLKGIKNSSKPNDVILDLFGGSGSTLIACEYSERICYMMELDPKYIDVIIQRWEKLTGQKAEKII